MNKNRYIAVILAVVALAFTVFVFSNSAKVAAESKEQSDSIVTEICDILEDFGADGAKEEDISFLVRKFGHFAEYFLLSSIVTTAIILAFQKRKYIITAPIYCFLVALCDEFIIQSNTDGRSPEWRDCFIDICGTLLATAAVLSVFYLINRKRTQKEEEK